MTLSRVFSFAFSFNWHFSYSAGCISAAPLSLLDCRAPQGETRGWWRSQGCMALQVTGDFCDRRRGGKARTSDWELAAGENSLHITWWEGLCVDKRRRRWSFTQVCLCEFLVGGCDWVFFLDYMLRFSDFYILLQSYKRKQKLSSALSSSFQRACWNMRPLPLKSSLPCRKGISSWGQADTEPAACSEGMTVKQETSSYLVQGRSYAKADRNITLCHCCWEMSLYPPTWMYPGGASYGAGSLQIRAPVHNTEICSALQCFLEVFR